MTAKPQAMHLDNPEGGHLEIHLLHARIATLRRDGEAAMSPHDIRNGYSPRYLELMMSRQLLVILKRMQGSLKEGEQWIDRLGVPRQPYLLRDEIANLQKQIENMTTTTKEPTEKHPPPSTGSASEQGQGGGGALERLNKASEIRRAIFLLRAQLKEIRQTAKEKITLLERGQASLLDNVDKKQMLLFDVSSVSPQVQEILDDPSI